MDCDSRRRCGMRYLPVVGSGCGCERKVVRVVVEGGALREARSMFL